MPIKDLARNLNRSTSTAYRVSHWCAALGRIRKLDWDFWNFLLQRDRCRIARRDIISAARIICSSCQRQGKRKDDDCTGCTCAMIRKLTLIAGMEAMQ